jgi:hypothetical protein
MPPTTYSATASAQGPAGLLGGAGISANERRRRWQQAPAAFARLPATAWEKANERRLRRLALALVAVGLLWRFSHYLMRFPVWGDEAMLLVNYFTKGYLDVFGHIDNCQVAPLLFHWIELTTVRWLGTSELAVRLPAFLACLGSLALFWRLARMTLTPLSHTIAVGILSVSIWPTTMGALVKPYTCDLLFSLALLILAISWRQRPTRHRPLLLLTAFVPVVVLASYPSVFIGGAVSLALLPEVRRRRRDRKVVALFLVYNLLLTVTFVGHYYFVGRTHLASPNVVFGATADRMQTYWETGFPPAGFLAFLKWCVLANMGQIAAYPAGAANGGSILTVLASGLGLWHLYRNGRTGLPLLAAGCFSLWFVAGLMRCYPYGSSCRLAQHVAPFYCLLAGLGVSVLIQRGRAACRTLAPSEGFEDSAFKTAACDGRACWRRTLFAAGVLVLVGGIGIARDINRPYRDEDARWARELVGDLVKRVGDDPILVAQDVKQINPVFHWQLGAHGARVILQPAVDWERLGQENSLWVFSYGERFGDEQERIQRALEQSRRPWRCVERKASTIAQRRLDEGFLHCRVYHWTCDPSGRP